MELDASIWGSSYWFFIHTLTFTYPINPTTTIKKKYYDFLNNFYLFIPNKQMSKYYEETLIEYPIKPYLDRKDDLIKWGWYIHNKINQKLNKPILSLSDFYGIYYHKYNETSNNAIVNRKYMIYIKQIIFFVLCIILYMYIIYKWP